MRTSLFVAGFVALLVGLAGGCDASKAELEKARQELATVTAERDDLKTKLSQATEQNASLQKELTDLRAAVAPAEGTASGRSTKVAKKKRGR